MIIHTTRPNLLILLLLTIYAITSYMPFTITMAKLIEINPIDGIEPVQIYHFSSNQDFLGTNVDFDHKVDIDHHDDIDYNDVTRRFSTNGDETVRNKNFDVNVESDDNNNNNNNNNDNNYNYNDTNDNAPISTITRQIFITTQLSNFISIMNSTDSPCGDEIEYYFNVYDSTISKFSIIFVTKPHDNDYDWSQSSPCGQIFASTTPEPTVASPLSDIERDECVEVVEGSDSNGVNVEGSDSNSVNVEGSDSNSVIVQGLYGNAKCQQLFGQPCLYSTTQCANVLVDGGSSDSSSGNDDGDGGSGSMTTVTTAIGTTMSSSMARFAGTISASPPAEPIICSPTLHICAYQRTIPDESLDGYQITVNLDQWYQTRPAQVLLDIIIDTFNGTGGDNDGHSGDGGDGGDNNSSTIVDGNDYYGIENNNTIYDRDEGVKVSNSANNLKNDARNVAQNSNNNNVAEENDDQNNNNHCKMQYFTDFIPRGKYGETVVLFFIPYESVDLCSVDYLNNLWKNVIIPKYYDNDVVLTNNDAKNDENGDDDDDDDDNNNSIKMTNTSTNNNNKDVAVVIDGIDVFNVQEWILTQDLYSSCISELTLNIACKSYNSTCSIPCWDDIQCTNAIQCGSGVCGIKNDDIDGGDDGDGDDGDEEDSTPSPPAPTPTPGFVLLSQTSRVIRNNINVNTSNLIIKSTNSVPPLSNTNNSNQKRFNFKQQQQQQQQRQQQRQDLATTTTTTNNNSNNNNINYLTRNTNNNDNNMICLSGKWIPNNANHYNNIKMILLMVVVVVVVLVIL